MKEKQGGIHFYNLCLIKGWFCFNFLSFHRLKLISHMQCLTPLIFFVFIPCILLSSFSCFSPQFYASLFICKVFFSFSLYFFPIFLFPANSTYKEKEKKCSWLFIQISLHWFFSSQSWIVSDLNSGWASKFLLQAPCILIGRGCLRGCCESNRIKIKLFASWVPNCPASQAVS